MRVPFILLFCLALIIIGAYQRSTPPELQGFQQIEVSSIKLPHTARSSRHYPALHSSWLLSHSARSHPNLPNEGTLHNRGNSEKNSWANFWSTASVSTAAFAAGTALMLTIFKRSPAPPMAAVATTAEKQDTVFTLMPPQPASSEEPGAGAGPFNVVITGGSKGIGAALAAAFVSRGDSVCIAARSSSTLEQTANQLQQYTTGSAAIHTVQCDVSNEDSVENLMATAAAKMGNIDIVLCNAGSNAYVYLPLADSPPEALVQILQTNGIGTLLTCRAAIRTMRSQRSPGHVFVMKGAGSDGNPTKKYAAYGFSKAGMLQLAKSLAAECREAEETGNSPVGVHTLSPGLVYTELVNCGRDSFGSSGRFFVNMIAELPVEVASDLVPKLRQVASQGRFSVIRAPLEVQYLTPDKLLKKVYARLAKGENKDRFYPEQAPSEDADRKIRLQWTPWLEKPLEKVMAVFKGENEA